MKRLFLGILGTVFTVIVTLYIQDWFDDREEQTQFSLSSRIYETSAHIRKTTLKDALATSDRYSDSINITFVDIENTGSEPLTDQTVNVRRVVGGEGKPVLAVETVSFPVNSEEGVTVQKHEDGVRLSYAILNPGEKHRIWILHNAFQTFDVIARKPGLRVTSLDEEFNDESFFESDPVAFWFIIIFAASTIFIFGAFSAHASLADELGKRGFSPEEILKMPPEEVKK